MYFLGKRVKFYLVRFFLGRLVGGVVFGFGVRIYVGIYLNLRVWFFLFFLEVLFVVGLIFLFLKFRKVWIVYFVDYFFYVDVVLKFV